MRPSILQKGGVASEVVELVSRLVERVPWPGKRSAMADVTQSLLGGSARIAENVFGWGRHAVEMGMNELRTGVMCVNDLSGRHKPKTEDKHPQLLADIHAIMAPECQADPSLRTTLAYTNKTASAVRTALLAKGWTEESLPGVRTVSNILNRHDYRLRAVAKTRVQKKRRGRTPSSRTCEH
jgi:hypothetical protein